MGTPVRSGFVSPLTTYGQANDALLSESQKVLVVSEPDSRITPNAHIPRCVGYAHSADWISS
jgi:hypothetical protein